MTIGDDLAAALPELRAMAESLMRDTVRVERVVGMDESTGEAAYETVYTGKAKIKAPSAANDDKTVVGASVTIIPGRVDVPIDSGDFKVGDRVTVLTSQMNPRLTGNVYRLTAPFEGSATTATRMPIEEVPS